MVRDLNRPFPTRIRVADILLIVFLLAISALGIHLIKQRKQPGSFFLIEMNGEVVYRLSLHGDTLISLSGKTGIISIQAHNAKVRILETTCPLKICKRTGWIHKPGEAIICVPNRMVITIEGGERGTIDAVTE
jgi:hypothetical protein